MHICQGTIRVNSLMIYNPKTKETIFKEKNKKFKSVDEILSSKDKLESLFKYIKKRLGENNK